MIYPTREPFIANTDRAGVEYPFHEPSGEGLGFGAISERSERMLIEQSPDIVRFDFLFIQSSTSRVDEVNSWLPGLAERCSRPSLISRSASASNSRAISR